jgi:hypothetical protein
MKKVLGQPKRFQSLPRMVMVILAGYAIEYPPLG